MRRAQRPHRALWECGVSGVEWAEASAGTCAAHGRAREWEGFGAGHACPRASSESSRGSARGVSAPAESGDRGGKGAAATARARAASSARQLAS